MTRNIVKPPTSKTPSPDEASNFRPGVTLIVHERPEPSDRDFGQYLPRKSRAMANAHTLETLQHATAHLLLMAEEAPPETAEEMRELAARLQALCFSDYFEEQLSAQARPNEISAD